jgi:hypothetical protein
VITDRAEGYMKRAEEIKAMLDNQSKAWEFGHSLNAVSRRKELKRITTVRW